MTITGPSGSEIHYTVDGSTPTAESPVYSEPLTFTETTTLKEKEKARVAKGASFIQSLLTFTF